MVDSVADPVCLSRIRLFPSRIYIKEFKYFNPKKCFLSSRKYDPGFSSRIRILIFYLSRIKGSEGTGSRIRMRNPGTDPRIRIRIKCRGSRRLLTSLFPQADDQRIVCDFSPMTCNSLSALLLSLPHHMWQWVKVAFLKFYLLKKIVFVTRDVPAGNYLVTL